eukprot:977635-Pyramimonas_sp.AAC.1
MQRTHLMQPSSVRLSTGETAEHVYVMPKYKLNRVYENPRDMEPMLKLARAETARARAGRGRRLMEPPSVAPATQRPRPPPRPQTRAEGAREGGTTRRNEARVPFFFHNQSQCWE